jgi:hypothetical protein
MCLAVKEFNQTNNNNNNINNNNNNTVTTIITTIIKQDFSFKKSKMQDLKISQTKEKKQHACASQTSTRNLVHSPIDF